MDPLDVRADTPALAECAYLNYGAAGPSPRRVVEACEAALARHEYEVPAGEGTYPALFDALDETRAVVADHVGAAADDVALTQSTSDAIARVVAAMDWQAGDVVVRTDQEHAAGILPFRRLAARGVEVREVPVGPDGVDRDSYRDAVADARLVCLSSLTWTTGQRLAVGALTDVAQDAGARVLVDAVQSLGQHPVDVSAWGADAVAAAGHKWLLGPPGTGVLWMDVDWATALQPAQPGYRSLVDPADVDSPLRPNARRFELATVSPAPYAGLRAAIETIEAVGYDAIDARVASLTDRLTAGLDRRLLSPRATASGLVTFASDDPAATVERLAEAGVVVRTIPPLDAVRASVHAVSTEEDVDALLAGLS